MSSDYVAKHEEAVLRAILEAKGECWPQIDGCDCSKIAFHPIGSEGCVHPAHPVKEWNEFMANRPKLVWGSVPSEKPKWRYLAYIAGAIGFVFLCLLSLGLNVLWIAWVLSLLGVR